MVDVGFIDTIGCAWEIHTSKWASKNKILPSMLNVVFSIISIPKKKKKKLR